MTTSVTPGDRIALRDRAWRVTRVQKIAEDRLGVEVAALDDEEPRHLSVVSPPEEIAPLAGEWPELEVAAFDSFPAWARLHRLIEATLVRETGVLSGARFGRVQIEAYQLAPALRILAKPRPSLLVADDVGLGKTIEAGLAMLELGCGRRTSIPTVAPLRWVITITGTRDHDVRNRRSRSSEPAH